MRKKEYVFTFLTIFLNCLSQFPITAIREIKILKELRHQNIVQLKEIVASKGNEEEEDLSVLGLIMFLATKEKKGKSRFAFFFSEREVLKVFLF